MKVGPLADVTICSSNSGEISLWWGCGMVHFLPAGAVMSMRWPGLAEGPPQGPEGTPVGCNFRLAKPTPSPHFEMMKDAAVQHRGLVGLGLGRAGQYGGCSCASGCLSFPVQHQLHGTFNLFIAFFPFPSARCYHHSRSPCVKFTDSPTVEPRFLTSSTLLSLCSSKGHHNPSPPLNLRSQNPRL